MGCSEIDARVLGTGEIVSDSFDVNGTFARLVSLRLRPEEIEHGMERFKGVSAPLVRAQKGSLGIFGAGNRSSGSVCALSFWDSRDALERSNANPAVIEALAGYSDWMVSSFVVEGYAVVSGQMLPPASHDSPTWMTLVSATIRPGRLDEGVAALSKRLDRVQDVSRSFAGSLLLSPLVGNRIVAFEYWAIDPGITSIEQVVSGIDQRISRSSAFQSPIQREVFEVFEIL